MSNVKAESRETNRDTRKEMSRHAVDIAEVQISSSHGVIHLHGRVRPMRGHEDTFEADVSNMIKALRQRPGIRDVITEWTAIF